MSSNEKKLASASTHAAVATVIGTSCEGKHKSNEKKLTMTKLKELATNASMNKEYALAKERYRQAAGHGALQIDLEEVIDDALWLQWYNRNSGTV